MSHTVRKLLLVIFAMIGFTMLNACSEGTSTPPVANGSTTPQKEIDPPKEEVAKPPDPITLYYYTNDNTKWLEIEEPLLAQRFPHITFRIVKYGQGTTIQDVTASGDIPDLVSFSMGSFWDVKDAALVSDMSDLIKSHQFDMGRFIPGVVESVQSFSDKGEILLLPFELNSNVLYYNKAIFDKFSVDYPRDDMTWDDLVPLVQRLSRKDGDTVYRGFTFNHQNLVWKNQLGLTFVDPSTNKATVDTPEWRRWLETMGGFYFIQGNENTGGGNALFYTQQVVAMFTGQNIISYVVEAEESGFDWDIVSLPKFSGVSLNGTQMIAPFYTIPPTSKNRDAAFEVITYLLSEEVQTAKSKKGKVPIINSEVARTAFATEIPGVEEKNMVAFLKDPIRPTVVTRFDGIAKDVFYRIAIGPEYYNKTKDVNTLLRGVEEEINQKITEALAKQ